MNAARRIGRFFVLLGVGIIGFFVLSDLAQQANMELLLVGGGILVLGILILITNPAPEAPPDPHFRTLKRAMKREEQIEKKEEGERK